MDAELKVMPKTHYGETRIYPVNDQAREITYLTGRKTFTERDVTILKRMGFTVTVITADAPAWLAG